METALVDPSLVPPLPALLRCEAPARRVLVVEDDLELEVPIRGALRELDPRFRIDWFTEGGLVYPEICRGCDLVIADIRLPGETSGLRLWSLCRLFLPELPFLLISATCQSTPDVEIDPRRVPAFLAKPFTPDQLKRHVRAVLASRGVRNGHRSRNARKWFRWRA
jgi:DNA-binding NtrC family response regulator